MKIKKPRKPIEYYFLGNLYLEQGENQKAIDNYLEAINKDYNKAKVYNNLAIALKGLDKIEEANKSLLTAIQLDPKLIEAYNNIGNTLMRRGQVEDAIRAYEKAIEINPYYKDAYNNLGTAWHSLGVIKKAVYYYKYAIKLNPIFPDALNNLGTAYQGQKKLDLAIKTLKKAIKIRPNFVEAYYNMGTAFMDKGEHAKAIEATKMSLSFAPEYQDANHQLLQLMKNTCDWDGANKQLSVLEKLTDAAIASHKRPGETPFLNITTVNDPKRNLEVAQLWSTYIEEHARGIMPPFVFAKPKKQKILRIGYLSSDYRDHVIAHHFASIFKYHNRKKFMVFAYSNCDDDKSYHRKYIKKTTDIFRDIKDVSFADAAEQINKDNIDILVDLNGHTRGATLEISALRPSPVQATYLGFPGSCGADFIDYVITDKTLTPPLQAKYYTEKFVYMPDVYQISSYELLKKDKKVSKKNIDIPNAPVIFCSFNNNFKISKDIFETWLNILNKVPDSVLWILDENKTAKNNLVSCARKRNLDKRVIFAKRTSLNTHLYRLGKTSIALDTSTYNGGATTSNALWTGVPVIALKGKTYVSRMSTSLLTAVGLPELVVDNLDEYEKLAVSLGNDPKKLSRLTKKLARNIKSKNIFNSKLFVKNLEHAYKIMWDNYCKGDSPKKIII